MSHTMVNCPAVESTMISGMLLPFSDSPFPQKPGGLQSSPGFQPTYRPRITAGALLRSHMGRADEDFEGCVEHAPSVRRTMMMEMMVCFFIFGCILVFDCKDMTFLSNVPTLWVGNWLAFTNKHKKEFAKSLQTPYNLLIISTERIRVRE